MVQKLTRLDNRIANWDVEYPVTRERAQTSPWSTREQPVPDFPKQGLPARGWANTEIGTANEATTRKHDVALHTQ